MIYYGKREKLWPDRVSTWEKHSVTFNDFPPLGGVSGVLSADGATTSWNNANSLRLGGYYSNTYAYTGSWGDILVFSGRLSESNRNGIEAYLGQKYGFNVSGTPISPSTLNPYLWIDPTDEASVTTSNGSVVSVNDKSLNNLTITPAGGTQIAYINGVRAISDFQQSIVSWTKPSEITVVTVINYNTVPPQFILFSSNASAGFICGVGPPGTFLETSGASNVSEPSSYWVNSTAVTSTPTGLELYTALSSTVRQSTVILPKTAIIHGAKVKPTVQWDGGASITVPELITDYSLDGVVPSNEQYALSIASVPTSTVTLDLLGTPTAGELDLYLNVSYPE